MSKYQPRNEYVLILPDAAPEKSPGGIILTTTKSKDRPVDGTVVAVGPGKLLDNGTRRRPEVEKGNKVIFNQYTGAKVDVDGKEHVLIREDEIFAITA